MGLLSHEEVLSLHQAILSARLLECRLALLAGIDISFVANLRTEAVPSAQILQDLHALNTTESLADGTVPLAIWLTNAAHLAGAHKDAAVFTAACERIGEARVRQPAARSNLDDAVEAYRTATAQNERVQALSNLLGLWDSDEGPGEIDLLRLFVPQSTIGGTVADFAVTIKAIASILKGADTDGLDPPIPDMLGFVPRSVEEVVSDPERRWVLLLGGPGAGKTALTQWILLKLCTPGELLSPLPEDLVPVRISLSTFEESYRATSKKPYDFFDHLEEWNRERSLTLGTKALRALASAGRLYFIFDGMDEVTETRSQRHHAEMITGLKREYPNCRGLVTSRVAGVERIRPLLEHAGFSTHTLMEFDDDRTRTFLDRWHDLAFTRAPKRGAALRSGLANALRESLSLRELCKSPLLAMMIAHVNRDQKLPKRRHHLYEAVIVRMAHRWDADKGLPASPGGQRFTLDVKLQLLRQLACHMTLESNGPANMVQKRELLDFTVNFCQRNFSESPDTARQTAEELLRHLRERHGVLVFLGAQTYGFAHRTFLEYLTAKAIDEALRQERIDFDAVSALVAGTWQLDVTREAWPLLCGLLQERRPEHVVALLQRVAAAISTWIDVVWIEYISFAIRCLAELEHLDAATVRALASRLTDILIHIFEGCARRMQGANGDPAAEALRLHVGGWPEFERLRTWVNTSDRMKAGGIFLSCAYECVIAAGGVERRVEIVRDALRRDEVGHTSQVMNAAAKFGPWRAHEVDAILEVVDPKSTVGLHIMLPLFEQVVDHQPLTSAIVETARSAERGYDRLFAAQALLAKGRGVDVARSALADLLSDSDPWLRVTAALGLIETGSGVAVLPMLVESCFTSPSLAGSCVVALRKLASTEPLAEASLADISRRISLTESVPVLYHMAMSLMASELFEMTASTAEQLFSRVQVETDIPTKLSGAAALFRLHYPAKAVVDLLAAMFDGGLSEEHAGHLLQALGNLSRSSESIDALLLKIMRTATAEQSRCAAAGMLARLGIGPEARSAAEQVLKDIASSGTDPQARLNAAPQLDSEKRRGVMVELAQQGPSSSIRHMALQGVHDDNDLRLLAASPDEGVRFEVDFKLRLRALVQDLLSINTDEALGARSS